MDVNTTLFCSILFHYCRGVSIFGGAPVCLAVFCAEPPDFSLDISIELQFVGRYWLVLVSFGLRRSRAATPRLTAHAAGSVVINECLLCR